MPDRPATPVSGTPTGPSPLLEALADLRSLGFDRDMFVTPAALVRCGACHHDAAPAELDLLHLRRVEGASDPGDMAAVLGVVCTVCGKRGTLVVRFGPEASAADVTVLRAVADHRFLP
jgi:hypothetical protein